MFIWTTGSNGNPLFINDEDIEPCDVCGERLGTCQMNACLDDRPSDDLGCSFCGAESNNRCHCDNDYEQWAGK